MKWIDVYIILVVTAILRLLIQDNVFFILSGIPLGIFMGIRRAQLNIEESKKPKDSER